MHRRAVALLALLAFGFAFAGCSKDDDPTVPDVTTTSALAATTTTAVTVPNGPVTSPEAAADGLYDSWVRGDQEGASRYARQAAVTKMFEHPHTSDGATYTKQGCEPEGGQFICSWTYEGGAMQMTVEGVLGNNGYVVDSLTYIAD